LDFAFSSLIILSEYFRSCSVQGEAVAFALGANARMLRVKTLAGVISTSPAENGEPLSKAEVRRKKCYFSIYL
jgi:tRNA A37 threonylcarbamoyladenosine modification protein TsaB